MTVEKNEKNRCKRSNLQRMLQQYDSQKNLAAGHEDLMKEKERNGRREGKKKLEKKKGVEEEKRKGAGKVEKREERKEKKKRRGEKCVTVL